MLSTRRHSPSGSPGNGEEYSRRDRQRISAATDAAIANMRAMGPSPFATGHLPNSQDAEARPHTEHSDQAAPTSSSPSNSRRNGNGKEDKPKKPMGNKALIVGHNWGGPLQGGLTDAVHLLARLLRDLGLAVYCTTLTATEDEIKEAREYGVELVPPSPLKRFKVKGGTPDPEWLYQHKYYFPNLKDLANVRFVFGFGMITSEAAFEIERDVFPKAAFYLINLFGRDVITPVVASCGAPELELRRDSLCKEAEDSRYVFSVGGSTFREYKKMYKTSPNIKHYRLSPIIDENNFKIPSPDPVDDDDEFQILSLFKEHELQDLTKNSVIVKAMNAVADSFHKNYQSPPKWRILGVPKRWESDLKDRMDPHPKLKVVLARMPSAKVLNDEIGRSNLVLLPTTSVHYVNLTLAALSAAVPIIIPEESMSHELIKKHFPEHKEQLVVDMSDSDTLQQCILNCLYNYEIALKRANGIKKAMERNMKQELEDVNDAFFQAARDDAKNYHGTALEVPKSPVDNTQGDETKGAELKILSRKRKLEKRDPGDIKVKVQVSEVVPEDGRTVVEVERGFYESEEVKEKTEEVSQMLDKQHDQMEVKDIGHESISYTMACRSLDALECLKGKYENGKLQDMMEDEFLSDELLDKIGAFYLAIDVTIDYEEYFLGRKELMQKYGIPTHSDEQQTDHGTTESTEPQKTDTSLGRVNRARELLKDFQREGDVVTDRQINMLDKFLQEKKEMRKTEHQKALQQILVGQERVKKDPTLAFRHQRLSDDSGSTHMTDLHLLTDEEIEQKNEELEAKVNELMISSGIGRSRCREKGQGRDIGKALVMEKAMAEERKLSPLFSEFLHVKSQTKDLETNNPELVMKTEKLSAYADRIVGDAGIPEETKEVYLDVRRVEKGHPVKESVLEVFWSGSMPGQFNEARGIYIKNNGQWIICDSDKVQVIDPIQLRCDLILQFHAFPKSFDPYNVTVDEDNDQYFMSDRGNGQVVVSSGQSKILNCFGHKEGIVPTSICLSPDGFIVIGDLNGCVRKYNKSGEHIARTEEGQVRYPRDLIVNKKCIFVSDGVRQCVHVLNHQMQSIRDIGKNILQGPYGLCFDHQQDGIYVCDYWVNGVLHFNCEGEFLGYKGLGQLNYPRYIALCKDNPYRLVVTQSDYVKLLYI